MYCTCCEARFVWAYEFVGPKQRYSRLFGSHTVEQSLGSTAAHSARMQQAPASTVQRMHNEAILAECERIYERVWEEAKETAGLVLGVDDFATKKGHTYNTGIHNLKGETMLTCCRDESWRNCGRMPKSTRDSFCLTRRQ